MAHAPANCGATPRSWVSACCTTTTVAHGAAGLPRRILRASTAPGISISAITHSPSRRRCRGRVRCSALPPSSSLNFAAAGWFSSVVHAYPSDRIGCSSHATGLPRRCVPRFPVGSTPRSGSPEGCVNEPDPQPPRQPDSRRAAVLGLLIALLLIVLGLILVRVLGSAGRLQDCVMSGRTNCAPIDSAAPQ